MQRVAASLDAGGPPYRSASPGRCQGRFEQCAEGRSALVLSTCLGRSEGTVFERLGAAGDNTRKIDDQTFAEAVAGWLANRSSGAVIQHTRDRTAAGETSSRLQGDGSPRRA